MPGTVDLSDLVDATPARTEDQFAAVMDKTFGKGKWRETGGFRTPAKEAELRAEGAQTVPPGHISPHSEGDAEAPGARDVVVDGLTPQQVADKLAKSGAKFRHFFPEGASGTQGAHLHIDTDLSPDPVKLDDLVDPPAAPAKPKPTPRQSLLSAATEPYRNVPGDIGHEYMEAGRYGAEGLKKIEGAPAKEAEATDLARRGKPIEAVKRSFSALGDVIGGAGQSIEGVLGEAAAPITGAAHALVGRPVEGATGSPLAGRVSENVAAVAVPFAGEAKIAGEAAKIAREEGLSMAAARQVAERRLAAAPRTPEPPNGLKAVVKRMGTDDPEHIAAVNRLKAAGVQPAEHQAAGGAARRIVESAKSNPYVGEGVRTAEAKAAESFNRGVYNKVLEPLGEKVPDSFPVGRDGIRAVKAKMDREYETVLPHVRVVMDGPTVEQLAEIRTAAAKLGKPQEQQFEAILNQDVLHKIGPSGMDGRTFKSVESDLLRQARGFKGSPDPNQRELGRHIEDVIDVLRQDMVDHSPAKYRARLQALNSSYARFTRLEDAAARRQGGAGDITPQDLLAAVKKGDHTVRKGAFARGDALLQGFAEDADRVLTPKVRDSGTAERTLANRFLGGHGLGVTAGAGTGMALGGPAGAAFGGLAGAAGDMAASRVTNALAHRVLSGASRTANTRNYLRAAQQRALAPRAAIPAAAALPPPQQPGG